jgi:NAD(P)-dependent dehydrogenase (short-subunit alcohol dehydrogenase family)
MTRGPAVAIVTGGSRGIGAACSKLLAARGYLVIVNYANNEAAARAVVGSIEQQGGKAVAMKGDVASEADILNLFAEADRLGTLKVLVNNAGITGLASRIEDMSVERLQNLMNTNFVGTIVPTREAIRRMSTKRGGSGGAIVNMGSAAALLGAPGTFVDYAASKGAIDSFTIGAAREVAEEGIRINAVRPGIIDTDIHASGGMPDRIAQTRHIIPMQREGSAEEVANAVVWLASDEASYVTGAILAVAGGRA